MALPKTVKKFADKDRVDQAIDHFSTLDSPTAGDLNRVKIASQVERGLDKYRAAAKKMNIDELEDERHQSSLLSHFMSASGNPKPHSKCHCHAIVSGAHQYAAELRAVIAWLKMRIDDPDNGVGYQKTPPHVRSCLHALEMRCHIAVYTVIITIFA